MKLEKFESEINTLDKFFSIFCKDKHKNQYFHEYIIPYKDKEFRLNVNLCKDCHILLEYAINRLRECPHDPKPRCRKCPNPCYEKEKWRQMAKIMKYSGMKLGLIKIKRKLKTFFKKN